MAGAGLHHGAMIERVCVGEDSLRFGFEKHVLDAREKDVVRESEFRLVECREFAVGLGDADDLNVGAMQILLEEAADVSVNEAGDGDSKWG
jgi:hypothetical protein